MKRAIILSALLLASLPTFPQTIYKTDDKFSGDTHFYTESRRPELEGGSFFSRRYVDFSFHAFKQTAKVQNPYVLRVTTETPGWVFINRGESLLLKLDGGEMLRLQGDGSMNSRQIVSSDHVIEAASYQLNLETLERIGKAKSVEFRIVGDRQSITGSWQPELIADAAFFAVKGPELLGIAQAASPATLTIRSAEPQRFGVQFVAVTQSLAESLRMPVTKGVMVVSISQGSVAEKTGLRQGDVVLRFGERAISTPEDLQASVTGIVAGAKVSLRIWRAGAESDLEAQF